MGRSNVAVNRNGFRKLDGKDQMGIFIFRVGPNAFKYIYIYFNTFFLCVWRIWG